MFLDELLAQKFMNKMSGKTTHNINIINEQGIIIASSKHPERIGTFHEIAFNLIKNGTKELSQEQLINHGQAWNGINLLIKHNNQNIGVCGVTGDPNEVYDIAVLVKMAFETMIEYEVQHERILERKNLNLRFLNTLLYHENESLVKELPSLCRTMGYDPTLLRIPIMISVDKRGELDLNSLLGQLRSSCYYGKQDISAVTRSNRIIIFKSFHEYGDDIFSQYKGIISEYLENLKHFVLDSSFNFHFFIGSFQHQITNYAYSMNHCRWLRRNYHDSDNGIIYFYDYIGEYMMQMVPFMEISRIFDVYNEYLSDEMKTGIIETIGNLEKNNYNLNTTSKELFIHKNTLIFRFNKIKSLFDINPVQEPSDRNFISYLTYYLSKLEKEAELSR